MNRSTRSTLLLGAAALVVLGCASKPVEVKTAAGPADDAPCPAAGPARISGRLFARQRSGSLVSGAGRPVYLDPATAYATGVFQAITERQNRTSYFKAEKEGSTVAPDAVLLKCRRTSEADGDGTFVFDKVAPGSYFVSSYISWLSPASEWLGTWNVSRVSVGADGSNVVLLLSGVPESIPAAGH